MPPPGVILGVRADEQVENIVLRSYQYVAVYNVINKAALNHSNPMATGGWNKMFVAAQLVDHNVKSIARPNNDSLLPGLA